MILLVAVQQKYNAGKSCSDLLRIPQGPSDNAATGQNSIPKGPAICGPVIDWPNTKYRGQTV